MEERMRSSSSTTSIRLLIGSAPAPACVRVHPAGRGPGPDAPICPARVLRGSCHRGPTASYGGRSLVVAGWTGTLSAVSDAAIDVDEAVEASVSERWQLDAFARSLLAKSPATVRAYESDLRAFAEWAERGGNDGPELV